MAKNHLTGNVRAPSYFGPLGGEPANNIISGSLHGDGTNISNVARVVANGTTDYVVTIGSSAQNLVGEPNLRFNGSRLYVNGAITGSSLNLSGLSTGTATSASYLAIDSNNDIILTSSAGGSGGSITVKDDGSDLTTSLSSLNFVGAGVTATNSGDDVTVTITGNTLSRNAITSTTTSSVSNTILGISASADLEVRLPAASGFTDGQSFIIKDEGGNADLHTITILPTGADTIDGRNSLVLESPHAALRLYTDGSSKFFIV